MSTFRACVLAAGKGTRMGGTRPKVLVEAGGKPLLHWVLEALSAAGAGHTVAVVGFEKEAVIAELPTDVEWALQSPQLGTGHAVRVAREALQAGDGPVLVCLGDMPLLTPESFRAVVDLRNKSDAACVLLTVTVSAASRFGRVVRDDEGRVARIVEYRDATEAEQAIDEGNTGVMCFSPERLWEALSAVDRNNDQGEYYLTDVIGILIEAGHRVEALRAADPLEGLGVNDPSDLQRVETRLSERAQA